MRAGMKEATPITRALLNPNLLSPREAAAYLGGDRPLNPKTLERWRREHRGPRFAKIGGLVRYRREWLDEFIAANTVTPELRVIV